MTEHTQEQHLARIAGDIMFSDQYLDLLDRVYSELAGRGAAVSERRQGKIYGPSPLLVRIKPTTVNLQKFVQYFLTQLL